MRATRLAAVAFAALVLTGCSAPAATSGQTADGDAPAPAPVAEDRCTSFLTVGDAIDADAWSDALGFEAPVPDCATRHNENTLDALYLADTEADLAAFTAASAAGGWKPDYDSEARHTLARGGDIIVIDLIPEGLLVKAAVFPTD
jgi:hypothetical protein